MKFLEVWAKFGGNPDHGLDPGTLDVDQDPDTGQDFLMKFLELSVAQGTIS